MNTIFSKDELEWIDRHSELIEKKDWEEIWEASVSLPGRLRMMLMIAYVSFPKSIKIIWESNSIILMVDEGLGNYLNRVYKNFSSEQEIRDYLRKRPMYRVPDIINDYICEYAEIEDRR